MFLNKLKILQKRTFSFVKVLELKKNNDKNRIIIINAKIRYNYLMGNFKYTRSNKLNTSKIHSCFGFLCSNTTLSECTKFDGSHEKKD